MQRRSPVIKEKVTIYTIAKELSLSPSMVSRAFNPNANVAEEKRRLILETAQKRGFSPNKLASRLSMKTIRIGILVVYKAAHVRDGLLKGIELGFDRLKDYKIEYTVRTVNAKEKSAKDCREELFEFKDFDGVILSGFGSSSCRELINEFSAVNPNVVFMQNVCEDTEHLFSSKHDEALAGNLAAQLLYERLHYSKRKNVFVFTGDRTSSVHSRTLSAFCDCAKKLGLHIIGDLDMKDSDDILSSEIDDILEKYGKDTDGMYISSGNSSVLCEALERSGLDISLVCSDVNDSVSRYIEKGVVFATLCQSFENQSRLAFEELVMYLLGKSTPKKVIYTDVLPVFFANLSLYKNK
ncbi:MAG: LacI family DNA-binding transcriptional regulator [Clostridia bacterium]|nr:LacI family DNA-binding transcriptional regulator [Clostridia bacterium]